MTNKDHHFENTRSSHNRANGPRALNFHNMESIVDHEGFVVV
jgi:hypothetical protein